MTVAVKTPAKTPAKTWRADAVRNRKALLAAARRRFAREGFGVPVDDLAREAGIAVGTVYRHFPTKDALVEAVIGHAATELRAAAESALASGDPSTALYEWVRTAGRVLAHDRVLVEAARARPGLRVRAAEVGALFDVADALLAEARTVGAVRTGVDAGDVSALLAGVGETTHLERYLDVVCAGLRPGP